MVAALLTICQDYETAHCIISSINDSRRISYQQCLLLNQKPSHSSATLLAFRDTRAKRSSLILLKVRKPATATDSIEQLYRHYDTCEGLTSAIASFDERRARVWTSGY